MIYSSFVNISIGDLIIRKGLDNSCEDSIPNKFDIH